MNKALQYKLRMMGIPIEGHTNTFCDNGIVVTNVTDPAPTISKNHKAIAYHKVNEAVAASVQRIAHERGRFNLTDFLTQGSVPSKFKIAVLNQNTWYLMAY